VLPECTGRKEIADMEGATEKKRRTDRATVFLFTLIIAAIIPVNAAQTYSEAVSVSCYIEDTEMGNSIGNLTVPFPENAGQGCNSMYSGCKGKCIGCVSDFDITEDVCYDSTGRKFLK
jgi:hypothetical protein